MTCCAFVGNLLKKRWSPEQISHELVTAFPQEPERQLATRRSIRRSTALNSAASTANCRRRCGQGGAAASRTAAGTSAAGDW